MAKKLNDLINWFVWVSKNNERKNGMIGWGEMECKKKDYSIFNMIGSFATE